MIKKCSMLETKLSLCVFFILSLKIDQNTEHIFIIYEFTLSIF